MEEEQLYRQPQHTQKIWGKGENQKQRKKRNKNNNNQDLRRRMQFFL